MTENNIVQLRSGRKLGYAEYGDIKGKPVFYFHGWPSSRLQAHINDEIAKKHKVRIISVDRPGCGLSEFQKDRILLDWPDDVVQLANILNITMFSIIGVSGGGPYAAACGYKIPDRLLKVGIVVGLAPTYIPGLLEGMSYTARLGWANYAKFPILRTISAVGHYLNAKLGPSLGIYRFMFGSKSDRKIYSDPQVRAASRKNYRETFRSGYKGVELDLKLYTTEWGFSLKDIKAQVFLFYGEDDKNVPISMGKYYASQIHHSKLTVYPCEGHLASKTHSEEILTTLS